MPYSNDPENIPADQVRFLLGDTSASPDLSDSEIAYLLSSEGDNALRAAARGAEMIAARSTSSVDERRVGPLVIKSARSKSKRFSDLAVMLWQRLLATDGKPFAGGISLADKTSRKLNPDRVRPSFSRRMMPYPNGRTGEGREDRLS